MAGTEGNAGPFGIHRIEVMRHGHFKHFGNYFEYKGQTIHPEINTAFDTANEWQARFGPDSVIVDKKLYDFEGMRMRNGDGTFLKGVALFVTVDSLVQYRIDHLDSKGVE